MVQDGILCPCICLPSVQTLRKIKYKITGGYALRETKTQGPAGGSHQKQTINFLENKIGRSDEHLKHRIFSQALALSSWRSLANSQTGSIVRVELGSGERHGAEDGGIH